MGVQVPSPAQTLIPKGDLIVAQSALSSSQPRGTLAFKIVGAVIADQPRSLDWKARGARLAGKAGFEVTLEVRAKLKALLLPVN